jgi:Uncharacterized protein conserved in bacteria
LKERIAKTIEYLKSVKQSEVDGTEGKEIKITFPSGQVREFTGQSLLLGNALPELLFPRHHRLRHRSPVRRRGRQARFHGHAAGVIRCRRPLERHCSALKHAPFVPAEAGT